MDSLKALSISASVIQIFEAVSALSELARQARGLEARNSEIYGKLNVSAGHAKDILDSIFGLNTATQSIDTEVSIRIAKGNTATDIEIVSQ